MPHLHECSGYNYACDSTVCVTIRPALVNITLRHTLKVHDAGLVHLLLVLIGEQYGCIATRQIKF